MTESQLQSNSTMVALDDCIKIGRTRNITNRIQAYKQTNTNVEILFASPVSTFEHAEKLSR